MPGRSTLITVAPRSARTIVASGPASTREKSKMRRSARAASGTERTLRASAAAQQLAYRRGLGDQLRGFVTRDRVVTLGADLVAVRAKAAACGFEMAGVELSLRGAELGQQAA